MPAQKTSIDQEARLVIQKVLESQGFANSIIVLFGSRANDTAGVESDWDYLVIVSNPISISQKHLLIRQIKRKLARHFIPNDIILQTREEFEQKKNVPGTISRNLTLEGFVL